MSFNEILLFYWIDKIVELNQIINRIWLSHLFYHLVLFHLFLFDIWISNCFIFMFIIMQSIILASIYYFSNWSIICREWWWWWCGFHFFTLFVWKSMTINITTTITYLSQYILIYFLLIAIWFLIVISIKIDILI
jgi:hypothetical protein